MFGWNTAARQLDTDADRPKGWEDYDRILAQGLPPDELDRLAEAAENRRYADAHFDDADAARGGSGTQPVQGVRSDAPWDAFSGNKSAYEKADVRLYPPLAQAMVEKLSEHLYKRNPTRTIGADGEVNAVVQEIYKRQSMGAVWQELDRLTVIGGFAGVQFAGDKDPANPVRANVWGPDELVVWTEPENHREREAVVTLDQVDGRTRAQLWTRDKHVTYRTARGLHAADATRSFERVAIEDNPYRNQDGEGILPFAFAHFRPPVTDFTTDSPGTNFREANKYLLHGLDETADGVRYLIRPIGVAEGVDSSWSAPVSIRPGEFLPLVAGQKDAGGNGPQPKLYYLTSDNSWVSASWMHLNNYIDLTLELNKIPPSAIRMILNARSGVSILAEQAPLLAWTERRRRPFEDYEREAVSRCLQVLASHLRNQGRDSRRFEAVAADPQFSILWPRLYTDLPGAERDRADGVRLQWGLVSLIGVVQEREDCTEQQAFEKLVNVKQQNDRLTAAGINPMPPALGGGNAYGANANPNALPGPGTLGLPGPLDDGSALEDFDQLADTGGPIPGQPADVTSQADALSQEGG